MLKKLLAAATALTVLFLPALAQEARGSISGRVTDSLAAVIPNAKVTINNTLTNEIRTTTTNQTGYYEVNFLDISNIAGLFKHNEMHSNNIHQWFDSSIAYRAQGYCGVPDGCTGFEGRSSCTPGTYQVRRFPRTLDALREDGITNWDLKVERMFPIKPERGVLARFSVDLLNAFNHTNFAGPNTDPTSGKFGQVDTQRGLSRIIQFNLRVEF
jgi:hypothetical protein